jgi:peroxiredoxin
MNKTYVFILISFLGINSSFAQKSSLKLCFIEEKPKNNEVITGSLRGKFFILEFDFNQQVIPIEGLESSELLNLNFVKGGTIKSHRFFWIGEGANFLEGTYSQPETWTLSPVHPYQNIFEQIEESEGENKKFLIRENLQNDVGIERLYYYSDKYSIEELNTEMNFIPDSLKDDMNYRLLEGVLVSRNTNELKIGDLFLDFDLESREGNTVKLSSFEGNYILLDFASSSCIPCLKALPELMEINERFGEDLRIVSIWFDPNKKVWLESAQNLKEKITWTDLWDSKGEVHGRYGIDSLPYYLLIKPNGEIEQIWKGYWKGRILRKMENLFDQTNSD